MTNEDRLDVPDRSEINTREGDQLVSALFRNSIVGVAIFDSQLRYQTVNSALASMNALAATAHVRRRIPELLGRDAARVEPLIEQVLMESKPISNFRLRAKLSTRADLGYWVDSFYPLKDDRGKTLRVGAVVWEITKSSRLEENLSHLAARLRKASEALGNGGSAGRPPGSRASETEKILGDCIAETRAIEYLLRSGLLSAAQHDETDFGQPPSYVRDKCFASGPALSECEFESLGLTRRELEVLTLLAEGKCNKELAVILKISVRTVEIHRAHLMGKLGIHSVAELTRFAIRNHLVQA